MKSRNRAISLSLLLVISCAAAARMPQEMQGLDSETWPKEINTPGGRIVVYEPQLETFKGNRLTSRAAVSVTKTGASEPVFGGFWMESTLSIDAERRTAKAVDVRVTEIRFPNTGAAEVARLRQDIAAEIPRWNLVYSVDALHADLRLVEERKALAQSLKADVPEIIFRSHPAVLLTIQGEPAWRRLPGNSYRRLDNSALFVLQDEAGTSFLHVPPFWWTAKDPLGPWQPLDRVPGAVAVIWKSEPQPQLPPADPEQEPLPRPEVVVRTGPAELVWTDGPPRFAPIEGTDLLYVTNTESDVFLHIPTQMSYVLLSGRWYRTPYTKTAWEFVPADQLPADFSRIPLTCEKQHVLACVAGTSQAREALLDAEIPQTGAVTPGAAPDLAATYDGEPQFEEISGSSVQYAVNTSCSILSCNQRYYWCLGGIWYDSDFAVGPWFVCTWVPPAIYLIPPSCPYYYVTYCRIFSVTPRAVTVGYYPGYRGCYVWGRTVVYGTGWPYRCWTGNAWYPRPLTWGWGVRYSALSCGWSVRVGSGGAAVWGLRRPLSLRGATVQAGAGGWWGGVVHRRVGVDSYRHLHDRAPVAPYASPNLYARQPQRIAPDPARPPVRVQASPGGSTPPRAGRNDPSTPPEPGPREPHRAPASPRDSWDEPSLPHRPADRDVLRTPPSPPERRDGPRNPPPPPSRGEREAPRTPPPSNREAPRDPTPPPRERRDDAPRNPPPPPPPPPPRRDEGPRNPPPPPPPPRRDEGPRNPPPPRERRDDAPRNPPPPPPPPPPRRDEGPRNPPPPPPPPRREDPPRSPDRRRSAPPATVHPATPAAPFHAGSARTTDLLFLPKLEATVTIQCS